MYVLNLSIWFVDPFLLRLALERYSAFFAYRISFSCTQNIDVEFHPARENSLHFATPDDVWGISADIPRWWRVTSVIWVVFRICRAAREISFNQSEGLHSFLVRLKTILRWHGCSRFASQFFFVNLWRPFPLFLSYSLFTWRWGTPVRWGNPPVHIITYFTWYVGWPTTYYLTYMASPTSM